MTKVLPVNKTSLLQAAKLLKADELVAFPTETVYGLGANALSDRAVEKIFAAKGRPQDNPLIVHVCSLEMFESVAHINKPAYALISTLMPSSLTLVLKKKPCISNIITAGLDTVAVRMPNNLAALDLIRCANVPLAAPSANTSTRPSPTTAQAVLADMDGKIQLILDGGKCEVGIESTVLDLTADCPTILRQGIVIQSTLENILQTKVLIAGNADSAVKSPGVKYKHYAPNCKVVLNVSGNTKEIKLQYMQIKDEFARVCIMCADEYINDCAFAHILPLGKDARQAAERLYENLLEAEKSFDCVLIVWTDKTEVGMSVLSRLLKASC